MDNKLYSSLGIYEKALPDHLTWEERLSAAKEAGFDYIELSIDENDWRIERLDWGIEKRLALRRATQDIDVSVMTICLSAHRRFPLGSADPEIRQKGIDILKKSIDFALDIHARIILVPGYDVFYEPSDSGTKERFLETLFQVGELASKDCVMLALENTDKFVTSISYAKHLIDLIGAPWFQIYGDVGNLVACGENVLEELEAGSGHIVGIHLKDSKPGQLRNVPFGEGDVLFREVFSKLVEIKFHGPVLLEMWHNPTIDHIQQIKAAREWILSQSTEYVDF